MGSCAGSNSRRLHTRAASASQATTVIASTMIAMFKGEKASGQKRSMSALAADQLLERGLVADWIEVGVFLRHVAAAFPHVDRLA